MKIAIWKQSIKEGTANVMRHPIVTLASVTTITMMLVLLGAFILFSANANQIATNVSQKPPIVLWVDYGATAVTVDAIDKILETDSMVKTIRKQTPEENFVQFKNELGNDAQVLDGFDYTLLPYTFTIQLKDISQSQEFKTKMEGVFGVRKVEYSQPVTEFLNKTRSAVNLSTFIAFIILCGITLFIISNMVRIAVFSRAEEIGIMKYVGATNWYIRVPYIIEGSIVGILGAALANIIVLAAYSILFNNVAAGQSSLSFLQMVPVADLSKNVILINTLFGVLVGAGGSALSVRHHVKV
ncbi:MAG: cell division protein FtsX [Saccharofermentanales bacterium]